MPCYHPLKGFKIGVNEVTGKDVLKVTSFSVDYLWKFKDGDTWYPESGTPAPMLNVDIVRDFVELPCGQCSGCRIKRAQDWANRCMLEAQQHESNYFITLTYDNDHLPINFCTDDLGNSMESKTLCPDDLTKFWKRLRTNSGQKIRYYACGEYGDKTARPHYHAIVFGLKLDDLELWSENFQGDKTYTSKFLEKTWGNGRVIVASVTWESCCYTARYCMKKMTGELSYLYDIYNIEPEFVRMSRDPGLGFQYFEDNYKKIYETDELFISTSKGGRKFKPPKYYDKLYEYYYPDELEEIKDNRSIMAESIKAARMKETSLSYLEYLSNQEKSFKRKLKKLDRSDV